MQQVVVNILPPTWKVCSETAVQMRPATDVGSVGELAGKKIANTPLAKWAMMSSSENIPLIKPATSTTNCSTASKPMA